MEPFEVPESEKTRRIMALDVCMEEEEIPLYSESEVLIHEIVIEFGHRPQISDLMGVSLAGNSSSSKASDVVQLKDFEFDLGDCAHAYDRRTGERSDPLLVRAGRTKEIEEMREFEVWRYQKRGTGVKGKLVKVRWGGLR